MGPARTGYTHNTIIYTTHINSQPKLINDASPMFSQRLECNILLPFSNWVEICILRAIFKVISSYKKRNKFEHAQNQE